MAEAASVTLQNLEWRLKRLEHFLSSVSKEQDTGDNPAYDADAEQEAVGVRLKRLESRTQQLVRNNQVANALVNLCMRVNIDHQLES